VEALVGSLASGSRSKRPLGVNDAVADLCKTGAQSVAVEHLMPMTMPGDASGSTASRQNRARAENGYCECPTPREWSDQRSGHIAAFKKPPKLPDVRLNARDAFLSVHCGDH
jgi:hypothetical protein